MAVPKQWLGILEVQNQFIRYRDEGIHLVNEFCHGIVEKNNGDGVVTCLGLLPSSSEVPS